MRYDKYGDEPVMLYGFVWAFAAGVGIGFMIFVAWMAVHHV